MAAIRAKSLTETAFRKVATPPELQALILNEYANLSFRPVSGEVEFDHQYGARQIGGISNRNEMAPDIGYAPVSTALLDTCYTILTPLLEDWVGCRLTRSWGYGIRSYGRGSVLHLHRDRYDTHVVSCIIHVDDRSEVTWPLDFVDHNGKHHLVPFSKGETLFYESLCPHARLAPFEGDYYRNMYLHWRPEDWSTETYENMKVKFASLDDCLAEWRE